ncbi:hypothetical protein R6Q59_005675 [Mikania micrantha]
MGEFCLGMEDRKWGYKAVVSSGEETAEHLLIACHLASGVWQSISQWCNIPPIYAFRIRDLLELPKNYKGNKTKKNLLHAVIITVVWCIWKIRNGIVHNGISPSIGSLVEEVKSLGFLWVKNRAKLDRLDWNNWKSFNVWL